MFSRSKTAYQNGGSSADKLQSIIYKAPAYCITHFLASFSYNQVFFFSSKVDDASYCFHWMKLSHLKKWWRSNMCSANTVFHCYTRALFIQMIFLRSALSTKVSSNNAKRARVRENQFPMGNARQAVDNVQLSVKFVSLLRTCSRSKNMPLQELFAYKVSRSELLPKLSLLKR